MLVADDVFYVGVTDTAIDLFEGQYKVPYGVTYNSYVILDNKIAVTDTVDKGFTDEWLKNIDKALCGKEPDYLIVTHMEPDHSASMLAFVNKYKNAKVVASNKAFTMAENFFNRSFLDTGITVTEGSELNLGKHKLKFISAPMVHWPEVTLAYDTTCGTLFSADAFGRFGTFNAPLDWQDEARRYYIGIVGKYGAQVQALLKKAAALDIKTICPLHGPVLKENIGEYIKLYNTWSNYLPEKDGVAICYTSVYGHTKEACLKLKELLTEKGVEVKTYDLCRDDKSQAIADAFKYNKLVLATTTYNADIFPPMREFIDGLTERGFKNRKVGLIENGSWAPMAAKVMRGLLEGCKALEFSQTTVKINSGLNQDSLISLRNLAEEISSMGQ